MTEERFDRSIRFFGKEGQKKLRATRVTLVGVGGLGTHVAQQLGLVGIQSLDLVDFERIAKTDRNRYVGVSDGDVGELKVEVWKRNLSKIDPQLSVRAIPAKLRTEEAFDSAMNADVVFGCLDNDSSRLVLNELCSAYARHYIDLASDIVEEDALRYGGRICVNWAGEGCLVCRGLLDPAEVQKEVLGDEAREDREAIYGVQKEDLGDAGPSVVFINGIVASWAVAEFSYVVSGVRLAKGVAWYRGDRGVLTVSSDAPEPGCYYCKSLRGAREEANLKRYLESD